MPTQETVFDEQGNVVTEETEHEETENTGNDAAEDENTGEPEAEGKYQIGDRFFNTLEEAHAFATSQMSTLQTEAQVADAYRQGIRDAISRGEQQDPNAGQQTPPEEDFDEETYFANPKEFLSNFAKKIKQETIQSFEQKAQTQQQSETIWREFTDRHPALADFRTETESFVSQNADAVRAIIATKGQAAGYDYVALKLREQFNRYTKALKPARELPNGHGGASPSGTGKSVTQKTQTKKPLSFAEQIRSIKKKR